MTGKFVRLKKQFFRHLYCTITICGKKSRFDLKKKNKTRSNLHIRTMFSTYAAFLFTSPFIQKGFDAIQNFVRIVFARDVQMHIAIPNMAVSDASYDIFTQLFFHHFHAEIVLDFQQT